MVILMVIINQVLPLRPQVVAELVVEEPPLVRLEPAGQIIVREGDRLSVACQVLEGDPAPSIQWERVSSSLPAPALDNILDLESVGPEDEVGSLKYYGLYILFPIGNLHVSGGQHCGLPQSEDPDNRQH